MFSQNKRQYRTHEFRETSNLDTVDILLWQKDAAPVPDECNRDFETFLQSTQYHYSPFELKDYSSGTLYINTISPGANNSETRLLFANSDNKNTYQIVQLPPGTGHSGNVFVKKNLLYAISEFSNNNIPVLIDVIVINPVTASYVKMSLVNNDEKVISYYVTTDKLFYMTASSSENCMGYRESFKADLHVYDFRTKEKKIIAADINSAQLYG